MITHRKGRSKATRTTIEERRSRNIFQAEVQVEARQQKKTTAGMPKDDGRGATGEESNSKPKSKPKLTNIDNMKAAMDHRWPSGPSTHGIADDSCTPMTGKHRDPDPKPKSKPKTANVSND